MLLSAEGEDISMYILLKTKDEKILAKQVKGAEAALVKKNAGVVSTLDQVLCTMRYEISLLCVINYVDQLRSRCMWFLRP